MKSTPNFGPMIKSARLGWRWCERHGCHIRMSDDGDHIFVELCPPNAVPSKKSPASHRMHRCWWDTPGILDDLPWLKWIRAVHKYICVEVNDDGTIKKELS